VSFRHIEARITGRKPKFTDQRHEHT